MNLISNLPGIQPEIPVQPFAAQAFNHAGIEAMILRLDLIHPVISGNKWFKLKLYLQDALAQHYQHVVTLGGAYSNHIVATAYACRHFGLGCTGIIRGERPARLSPSLSAAEQYGMRLTFITRDQYRRRTYPPVEEAYFIEEGGYGPRGAQGASDITDLIDDFESFTHIVCAAGTGTMLAGLASKTKAHQRVEGISVLKNNFALEPCVKRLLPPGFDAGRITIHQDYHFGGYAKHPPALINYMKRLYSENHIPTDIVYTAKLMYGVQDLATQDYFRKGNRLLLIHSGGLQGNLSLPAGSLPFS